MLSSLVKVFLLDSLKYWLPYLAIQTKRARFGLTETKCMKMMDVYTVKIWLTEAPRFVELNKQTFVNFCRSFP